MGGYSIKNAWGLECSLDLHGCNPDTIRSSEKLTEFVDRLCELIQVIKYGPATIVDFGEDARISGYSLVQLIETSLISGHFANQTNAAYINVFSCKGFDPIAVEAFCKDFFEAETVDSIANFRR